MRDNEYIYNKSEIPEHLQQYFEPAEIGLEESPDAYVARLVEVFREVRRILRDDGVVWLNLGDSYATSNPVGRRDTNDGHLREGRESPEGSYSVNSRKTLSLANKQLIGIPWRVAFALQADGWYLRQDVIWSKPNPMPESVSDRCTKSHEYIFLLSKSERYFYDNEAIKEPSVRAGEIPGGKGHYIQHSAGGHNKDGLRACGQKPVAETRNRRSVWTIPTKPFSGAHFAVFPEKLVEPCVLAGTSAKGCCSKCGTPWERIVEQKTGESTECPKTQAAHVARGGTGTPSGTVGKSGGGRIDGYTITVGWKPNCQCDAEVVPCVVFDPFAGSGTTGVVAIQHGRKFIGTELNPEYVKIASDRLTNTQMKKEHREVISCPNGQTIEIQELDIFG